MRNYYHAAQFQTDMALWTANDIRQYLDIDIIGRIYRSHFYGSRPAMDAARWTTAIQNEKEVTTLLTCEWHYNRYDAR